MPERPRYSAEGFDNKVLDLESKHRLSNNMSLKDEKNLIREISDLKKEKESIAPFNLAQQELEVLRERKNALGDRLKDVRQRLKELKDGLRKLDLVALVSAANPHLVPIDSNSLIEEELRVKSDQVGYLVGRRGVNLREIEIACGVTIDVDESRPNSNRENSAGGRSSNATSSSSSDSSLVTVHIKGLREGIDAAKARIEKVTRQEDSTLTVTQAFKSFMVKNAAANLKKFEQELELSIAFRGDDSLAASIRGPPAGIATFKTRFLDAEKDRIVITVDQRVIPSVIGSKGANLVRLRDEIGVDIDISKPPETPVRSAPGATPTADAKITLYYAGENSKATYAKAKAFIQSLIDDNTEKDVLIDVPKGATQWLLLNGGVRIQQFNKESNLYLHINRPENPAPNGRPVDSMSVTLRGRPAVLASGRHLFDALMHEFSKHNTSFTISTSQSKALVGPGGSNIKKLRAETGVTIEVDDSTGAGPATAATTTAAAPTKSNEKTSTKAKASSSSSSVPVKASAAAPAPAAASSSSRRNVSAKESEDPTEEAPPAAKRTFLNRADEANVPLGMSLVTIRGDDTVKVAAALALVRACISNSREESFEVTASVLESLLRNKGEALHKIEADSGASISISRHAATSSSKVPPADGADRRNNNNSAPGTVVIVGSRASVATASSRIVEIMALNTDLVFAVPDIGALSEFIGKEGKAISAFQKECNVQIDVNKDEKKLIFTGAVQAVKAAEAKARAFFDKFAQENVTINVDRNILPSVIGKKGANISTLEAETGAKIRVDSATSTIRLSGTQQQIAVAKSRIVEQFHTDVAGLEVAVDAASLGRLLGKGGSTARKIEADFNVSIAVDTNKSFVSIRGEPAGMEAAKTAILRILKLASRVEGEVAVPAARVGTILGPRGATLKSISEDTGAQVDLPKDRAGKDSISIKVRGAQPNVDKALAVIKAFSRGNTVRTMARPSAQISALSASIASIEALGVKVHQFDEDDDADALFIIEGAAEANVFRAVQAADRLLSLRFGDSYLIVSVPASALTETAPTSQAPTAGGGDDSGSNARLLEELPKLKLEHGISAQVVREGNYVALWGEPSSVAAASNRIRELVSNSSKLSAEVMIDTALVPTFIGKAGAGIKEISTLAKCTIKIDRSSDARSTIVITTSAANLLPEAKAKVEAHVLSLSKRRVLLRVIPSAFGAIVGKAGATIRTLQEESGCNFDLNREAGAVAIRGPSEASVASAVAKLQAVLDSADFHHAQEISEEELATLYRVFKNLDQDTVLAIIGKGGNTIKGIQDDTGASVNIDRDTNTISVTANTAKSVTEASAIIEGIITKARNDYERELALEKAAAVAAKASASKDVSTSSVVAPSSSSASVPTKVMTANSKRRARAKAAKLAAASGGLPSAQGDDDNEDDDEDDASITDKAAAVVHHSIATSHVQPPHAPLHHSTQSHSALPSSHFNASSSTSSNLASHQHQHAVAPPHVPQVPAHAAYASVPSVPVVPAATSASDPTMMMQQQSLSWEQQIQLLLGGDIKRFNFGTSQQPQPTMMAAPVIPHSAPAHSVAVSSSAASGAGVRKLSNPPPGLQKSVSPPVLPVPTAPSSSSRYSSSVSGVAATHPPHPMQDGSVEAALAQLGLLGSFPDLASSMPSSLGMHAPTTSAAAVVPPRFVGGGSSSGHSSWGNNGPLSSSVHHPAAPTSNIAPSSFHPHPIQNSYGSTVQPAAAVIRATGANTQAPTRKAVGGVNIRL